MTCPPTLSTFILNRVCDLVKKGGRVDLGFRLKYLKDVVEYVLKYCGRVVAPEQIYSHLRH
jgi:hypothetical protein